MRLTRITGLLVLVCYMGYSCKSDKTAGNNALFELKENTGIDFINKVENTKDFNIFSYRNFYNGGGAAIGDINNDSLPDVFFTSNMGENKLYLNKGNWKFQDISEQAAITGKGQWNTGVTMIDINSDGWLDIYVCNAGYINGQVPQSRLYINTKDGKFREEAKLYGLDNTGGYATHAAFFDYDLDGDLDVFIINNSFIPVNTLNYANKREVRARDWPVEDFLKGGGDRFLRNDNGKYNDISSEAGVYGSLISFGLGVTVGDVNGDRYPDVYVSNDFFERDYLYINQQNGTFKDELTNYMQHLSHSSMGADMADINNDGYADLFVTEMLPDDDYRLKTTTSFENTDVQRLKVNSGFYYQYMQNTLQVNTGNGKFLETAYFSGVAASDWSWGGLIFDADNDGLSDIYVCNGIYHDVTNQDFIDFFANDVVQKLMLTGEKEKVDEIINKMPSVPIVNKAFRNLGGLKFADSASSWGVTQTSFSNGAAYGDLDNDGDLDLIVNNVNQQAFVYKNNSRELNSNNYISVQLKGNAPNTFAIGSKIKIFQGNDIISRELIPSRGFQSSVDYKTVIGLGKKTVDRMEVHWPNGATEVIINPAVNKSHIIIQSKDSVVMADTARRMPDRLLTPQAAYFEKHVEDDFIDSYYDRNIPMMLSREGPKAVVGDLNGDALEDVVIGAARGKATQVYLQSGNSFQKKTQPVFDQFLEYEDAALLMMDCDKDGDKDLIVGSAGNNRNEGTTEMQTRLFRNDGKGNFSWDSSALPKTAFNTAAIIAHDYDGDGDEDLFIASRSIPLNYGPAPASYLLKNDGTGKFVDVTASVAPGLSRIGMITGAKWEDVFGDSKKELVVAGEWMAPAIYTYASGKFSEVATNLKNLKGWWQTVECADIDGDGDKDLLLGNIGENFYLNPDSTAPVRLWINDFDKNSGSVEKIFTRTIDKKDMPVFLKRDITDQLTAIKKQNLRYEQFAKKTIQELFDDKMISSSDVKEFNYSSSCIALNDGNGKFTILKMPLQMQLSSVNSIFIDDLNQDGLPDIIAGGNKFDLLPQFGRLDASFGHVLINKGKGEFELISSSQSGLMINGQVRDIAMVKRKKESLLIVLQNNDTPLIYSVNRNAYIKK